MSKIGNIVKETGKVLGVCALGALAFVGSVMCDMNTEEIRKEQSDKFADVLDTISASSMSSYYKRELITLLVSKDLRPNELASINAILKDDEMSDYYKYDTIEKIVK